MDEEQYILNTAAGLPEGPSLDTTLLDKSIQTLEMVSPLLENDAHRRFYGAIMNTYTALKSSSRRRYLKFVAVYAVWYTMGHREFLEFIAQENSVSQILFVHHVALQILMSPLLPQATLTRLTRFPQVMFSVLQRGEKIYRDLPVAMRCYIQWQVDLIASAKAVIQSEEYMAFAEKYVTTGFGHLTEMIMEEIGARNAEW